MAGRITVAEYVEARDEAVMAYVDDVSEATLATGDKNAADRKSAEAFVNMGVVWTNAPDSIRRDTARMRDEIEFDFEAAKDGAEAAILTLWDLRVEEGNTPSLSRHDARKNSTKGIRQRKIVLENTVECIQQDSALARSAYRDAASKAINWTELCAILANPLLTRAQESRMKVNVGIAKDGRRRLLTEDYAQTHVVETRELDDGTVEEFTTTTFGPKGDTEDVEVIISLVPSGELLAMALDDLARRKKLQAADNSVVRKLMEQARLPEFMIREARPRSSDR